MQPHQKNPALPAAGQEEEYKPHTCDGQWLDRFSGLVEKCIRAAGLGSSGFQCDELATSPLLPKPVTGGDGIDAHGFPRDESLDQLSPLRWDALPVTLEPNIDVCAGRADEYCAAMGFFMDYLPPIGYFLMPPATRCLFTHSNRPRNNHTSSCHCQCQYLRRPPTWQYFPAGGCLRQRQPRRTDKTSKAAGV